MIHEDAAALRGAELAAIIVQVVEGLDVIDQLPRLADPRIVDGKLSVWKGTLSLPMNWV